MTAKSSCLPNKIQDSNKNKKMKMMILDSSKSQLNDSSSDNSFLDLNISLTSSRVGSSRGNNGLSGEIQEEKPPPRVFTCNYCKGEFSTSQALGGHQNAHKQERARDKMRRVASSTPACLYHPYLGMYNIPYGGSYNNNQSPFGVKVNSMIHKPGGHRWPLNNNGYRYGYGGHSRPPTIINHPSSSSYHKPKMTNNDVVDSPINNLNNSDEGDAIQNLGGLSAHITTDKLKTERGNPDQRGGLDHIGDNSDQLKPESLSLDLSLKL